MFEKQNKAVRIIAVTACMAIPAPLLAGGYGDTAVRDGAVANVASSQATVPCARLNRNIPASLAAEMDCGAPRATPRVAGERVRNNPVAAFFDRFPHQRSSGPAAPNDDGPKIRVPTGGDDDTTSNETPPTEPPTGGNNPGPTPKWDRLSELGVTPRNFENQSDSFKEDFQSYANENGFGGDWSGFNPD